MNYTNLTEIIVKSQAELDAIPADFKGRIYVEFGKPWDRAIIKNRRNVEARGNSSVEAWGNSSVVARDNSSIEAWDNSSVVARENSSVVARENSSVVARDNSSIEAWERSFVEARGNSFIVARHNSSVVARGNSSVEAWGNSSVEARDNSSIEAWDNSSVVAQGDSSVEARENSSVVALDNSSVVAQGNSQIVDRLSSGKIQISGNARIVYMPKNIHEFLDFHGINHTKTKATFYKAVHKKGALYYSHYDRNFTYEINNAVENKCDKNTSNECSFGINISHLDWALRFGENWDDLAILELETDIDDIVLPTNSDGKVRTRKATVLREVPLVECGVYGKILSKRRKRV